MPLMPLIDRSPSKWTNPNQSCWLCEGPAHYSPPAPLKNLEPSVTLTSIKWSQVNPLTNWLIPRSPGWVIDPEVTDWVSGDWSRRNDWTIRPCPTMTLCNHDWAPLTWLILTNPDTSVWCFLKNCNWFKVLIQSVVRYSLSWCCFPGLLQVWYQELHLCWSVQMMEYWTKTHTHTPLLAL